MKSKNQNHSIQKTQNLGNGRKSIICKILGKMFYPNLQSFVWRRHVGSPLRGTNMTTVNKKTYLSLSFFYKSVNSSLEELIKIKVILILKQEMLRQQNLKKIGNIFSLHESCPGRHLHAASRKRFGNSNVPISQNEETFRTEHLYTAISRKFVKKCTRQSRKALWVVLSSMFFKEI